MKRQNKGITLVALILTIVILLILAVVTIRSIQGEGIISKAMKAREDYEDAAKKEQGMLDQYLQDMEGISSGTSQGGSGGDSEITISDAQTDTMLSKTTNTTVYDGYGNKIVIPAGFKILVDSTTGYTASNINVTKGIVITDGTNEFVWIPLGEIYTNTERTSSKMITLDRYTFDSQGIATAQGTNIVDGGCQELSESSYGNAVAKDLNGFITSANKNQGYYLGRYEAGVTGYQLIETSNSESETNWTGYSGENIKLVCKSGQQVWNYVTQNKASELSRNMYTNSNFTSDLVNSYAWDTAIVFIQEFSGDNDYSIQRDGDSNLSNTGIGILESTNSFDKQCNIFDMASNCHEFTTEAGNQSNPCVHQGGGYNSGFSTGSRSMWNTYFTNNGWSFRPLLYLNI